MSKRGLFITLEGIEGVGKTTVLEFIADYLKKASIDFITTREPGGTPVAEQIRQVILHPDGEPINDKTELLLIFACRSQHFSDIIMPALSAGKWVVSDRFTDATYAYQGGGRGISDTHIQAMEQFVQNDTRPDQIILLDAPVALARERITARGSLDRIEQEKLDFFEKVREKYLARANADPAHYSIVDATQSIDDVVMAVSIILDKLVKQ